MPSQLPLLGVKMKHTYTEQELREAVASSHTLADTLRKLNMDTTANHYKTLNVKIKQYNIDTSHFKGCAWAKHYTFGFKRDINDYLSNKCSIISHRLKLRLIAENIFEHKCQVCNNTLWNNQPIPIELHHINGNPKDNSLSNLQILCPNCHAQTETNSGKHRHTT